MIETGHRYEIECIDLSVEGTESGGRKIELYLCRICCPGKKLWYILPGKTGGFLKAGQSSDY